MKAFDLSHPLTENTPHPASAPAPHFEVCQDMPDKISRITSFSLCTHMGTHMDAPSHFVVGAKTITDYGMERFSLPAVIVRPDLGERVEIDVADLEVIESLVTPGCALLVATGMQTARWDGVPAHYLYHMLMALRRVGLEGDA
ncbi:MAG: cyclase family protein, partial [Myxococcaceae bacterium]